MASTRPNHPHLARDRRFTVVLKSNQGNTYLREQGICSLMDHELGTHYASGFLNSKTPILLHLYLLCPL